MLRLISNGLISAPLSCARAHVWEYMSLWVCVESALSSSSKTAKDKGQDLPLWEHLSKRPDGWETKHLKDKLEQDLGHQEHFSGPLKCPRQKKPGVHVWKRCLAFVFVRTAALVLQLWGQQWICPPLLATGCDKRRAVVWNRSAAALWPRFWMV